MLLSVGFAVLPIIALWILWGVTRVPNNGRTMAIGLVLGVAAAATAIVVGIPLGWVTNSLPAAFAVPYRAFVLAALVEESVKAATIALVLRRLDPQRYAFAMIGASVGVGFSFLENTAYIAVGPTALAFRTVTSVPLHIACSIIVAAALFHGSRQRGAVAGGIVLAIVLHGLYDLAIFSPGINQNLALVPLFVAAAMAALTTVTAARRS